tara:strand:+ start:216 stop:410 length:195 start_codon:yes stop_codon:yes gene_type:complete
VKIKYDKNNNPVRVPEPMVVMTKKWRKQTAEEFRKKYGCWWMFQGVPIRQNKKTWIEQYRKKGV